jgi:myo-inositol-1(or 4)-monophosphatase
MKSSNKYTLVAIHAALRAGEILRKGYATKYDVRIKKTTDHHNLVTEYDYAAEKVIINTLKEHFPEHGFLAEESGKSEEVDAPAVWIIDPLDGTQNFARSIPLFAVSIALYMEKHIQVGVIYQPITHELFVAERHGGAYLNGEPLRVSSITKLHKAVTALGLPLLDNVQRDRELRIVLSVAETGCSMRNTGSAAINLAYLAAGRWDAYWSPSLQPWDIAAGRLLVEEAGGTLSCYDGSSCPFLVETSVVGTNGILHQELLHSLRS